MSKWHSDARRLTAELFKASPSRKNQQRFNVWAIDVPAAQSGVARPSSGTYRTLTGPCNLRRLRLRALSC
ncbi:MAG: M64 family metallopeptidase [Acidobacteriota bacterium]